MNRIAIALAMTIAAAGGCATRSETYVLLPDRDGKVEALTVTGKVGKSVVLDQPYAAASGGERLLETVSIDKDAVMTQFGVVLAAQPREPRKFILYFLEGDELTAESKDELEKMFAEIASRPSADVMVVGHTDRVGKLEDNDALSLRRADRIRNALMARGLAADNVQSAGRGEREPLVPTADDVKEPLNRRVEVTVR